jgi:hypothetical protein
MAARLLAIMALRAFALEETRAGGDIGLFEARLQFIRQRGLIRAERPPGFARMKRAKRMRCRWRPRSR